ncbi:recombinase family protein [Proteus mirabilis]|uniref:recombinase family protein n=3 Tax=Proteus mirabilis TaxID=584 RepID=UPI00234A145A|nr:recombinase family protein [Proteus mirabilis]MDC5917760.1 recombinase family protein [Proteus mirabilis]MDC5928276.1 recombinase family protein [Proteus mirabilis]MDC6013268.1 recombinase family protein [Proteus mirabilis]
MSRIFIYCRCSKLEQDTANQVIAIRKYRPEFRNIPDNRVIEEIVSGGTPAMKRPRFASLVNEKLEQGDTLVVLKLDRLGRDNIDVQQTILLLHEKKINVVCLDLPVADLMSAEGRLMLQLFAAFAEFEKSRIIERTQEGLEKAKANGVRLGRPKGSSVHSDAIQAAKEAGLSQSKVAKRLGIGIATVKRHWRR